MKTTFTRRVMALTILLAAVAIGAPIAQAGTPPGHKAHPAKVEHSRSAGAAVNVTVAATLQTLPAQAQPAIVDNGAESQTCNSE
jgi:hypothetical protein